VFAAIVLATRSVSLGSIAAAVAFGGFQLWRLGPRPLTGETWSLAAMSLAVPLLILVRHRSNVVRLMQGREPRWGASPQPGENAASPDDCAASEPKPQNASRQPGGNDPRDHQH
jgi:glycerol-3-phosphate acyltransferase PlsY